MTHAHLHGSRAAEIPSSPPDRSQVVCLNFWPCRYSPECAVAGSMDRLKSKTGCLTCLARRKKCDEVVPQCGHCGRLGLNCVRRDQLSGSGSNAAAISSTNLKATKGVLLRASITNGHPPFGSDFEKQLSIESPGALAALVSCMAGPGFRDVLLFGTFSAESRLVRQALVAFSAYNQGPRCGDSYKLSLRSYQNCVLNLRSSRLMDSPSSTEQNYALTAIMFLGLLEVRVVFLCM